MSENGGQSGAARPVPAGVAERGPLRPDPQFQILGAEPVHNAAAPTLRFTGHVTETEGSAVYTIALSVQIMIEPAKRTYDDATRERLVELFGEPERWAATTRSFLWAELDVLVPAFTGATAFQIPMLCNYDLELAATKYLHSVPGGEVPLLFNFTGTIFYRGDGGKMQIVKVPWDCNSRWSMPVATWRDMIDHHYPNGGWVRLGDDTLAELAKRKAQRGLPSFDATVAQILGESG